MNSRRPVIASSTVRCPANGAFRENFLEEIRAHSQVKHPICLIQVQIDLPFSYCHETLGLFSALLTAFHPPIRGMIFFL